MREQLADATSGLSRQAFENVLEVSVRIVSVELGRLYETHDVGGTSAGAQRPGKQPVRSPEGSHAVILPISGKKLKFITAGIHFMVDAYACSTASSVPMAASCMLRVSLAL